MGAQPKAPQGFTLLRLKRAAPQNRLRIAEIPFDQQLLFGFGCREIHNGHQFSQPVQQMIPGIDDAAGRIQNQRLLRPPLKVTKNFVQRCNFFCEVL